MKTSKVTMKRLICSIPILLGLIFTGIACEGPEGPQGAEGPRGEQGPAGPQGPMGEDGNANVIYSDWMDADWNYTDEPDRKEMRVEINQIDYNVLRNNTLVVVYVSNYGDSSIYPLPSSGRWPDDEILYTYRFGDNQEDQTGLRISVMSIDGTNLEEVEYSGDRGNAFRYILIPVSYTHLTLPTKRIV